MTLTEKTRGKMKKNELFRPKFFRKSLFFLWRKQVFSFLFKKLCYTY